MGGLQEGRFREDDGTGRSFLRHQASHQGGEEWSVRDEGEEALVSLFRVCVCVCFRAPAGVVL